MVKDKKMPENLRNFKLKKSKKFKNSVKNIIWSLALKNHRFCIYFADYALVVPMSYYTPPYSHHYSHHPMSPLYYYTHKQPPPHYAGIIYNILLIRSKI